MPRVGLNPYALGMRLFYYIEEMADKGKYSHEFQRLLDADQREQFDKHTGTGQDFIFKVRENFCDFMFVNTFLDQDFVTRITVCCRQTAERGRRWSGNIMSKAEKPGTIAKCLMDSLYHPPHIEIDLEKSVDQHPLSDASF